MAERTEFSPSFEWILSRRTLIKGAGAGLASIYLGGCATLGGNREPASVPQDFSPIDRSFRSTGTFSGDDPERAHGLLWNLDSIKEQIAKTEVSERVPLVIVGGGISGLLSAYLLRESAPVVLEQASRFGGNSRGESWNGIDYSIGAAYLSKPEAGSEIEKLLRELGLLQKAVHVGVNEPAATHGKVFEHFWRGNAYPKDAAQFRELKRHFENVLHSRAGLKLPEIPWEGDAIPQTIRELDQLSFAEYLTKLHHGPLPKTLDGYVRRFCASTFGAWPGELSAAAGVNFLASEFGELSAFEGGNAAISVALVDRLQNTLPRGNLRSGSVVVDITVQHDSVEVTYQNARGEFKKIKANTAVCACPKFVAAKIVKDLEPERLAAIQSVNYRSYIVANALIKKTTNAKWYDVLLLDAPEATVEGAVTDVIDATHVGHTHSKAVLTLYRPYPHALGRRALYAPDSFATVRKQSEEELMKYVLPLYGFKSSDVEDIRLTRWGHPLPVPHPGIYTSGTTGKLREPFKERLFFVEQDNWALPAFETAAGEAIYWAPKIKKALQSPVRGIAS